MKYESATKKCFQQWEEDLVFNGFDEGYKRGYKAGYIDGLVMAESFSKARNFGIITDEQVTLLIEHLRKEFSSKQQQSENEQQESDNEQQKSE